MARHYEPLVLVPGLACTYELFVPQIAALCDHPLQIANTCEQLGITQMAERLLETAPERFALAGLSMGGYIAMEVMRIAPERVSRLALLSTNARADTPEATEQRLQQIRIAEKGGYSKLTVSRFPMSVAPSNADNEDLKQTVIDMAEDVGPQTFIAQHQAVMHRIDQRPHLSAITCPTLVLVGELDQITPPECAQEIHAAISNSTLELVKDCGHISSLEAPEAVTTAMVKWLRG
ncbi:alpha/beta fold hydrolase [Rhodobacteraceae bacterium RKSG542]|uniref:alpha/beta fold hydrolase n=1 Tax=Pseudovibrio flavus TaxID=2529854 RepID=UPI0012BC9B63|nr:alpha/beta fold hydrolase [Pseudovibrio flavus]MTI18257.1 alpha/beta fold hydrolase [Pseudovibrio flavus]